MPGVGVLMLAFQLYIIYMLVVCFIYVIYLYL